MPRICHPEFVRTWAILPYRLTHVWDKPISLSNLASALGSLLEATSQEDPVITAPTPHDAAQPPALPPPKPPRTRDWQVGARSPRGLRTAFGLRASPACVREQPT
ncbi:hypothetical protein AcW2_005367 [Taiwanofungus camphoratus]|nr:hypothetical protein AcW2_005367 [Antrodia cinnamomea]